MIDFTMSPETRKEKPTVPQPTGGSNTQTPRAVLRTKDPPTCDLCGSAEPTHTSLNCWQNRINTARELGIIPPTPPPTRLTESPHHSTAHTPEQSAREDLVHRGKFCDSCNREHFPGTRYHCTVCPDYDLCQWCMDASQTTPPHSQSHNMDAIQPTQTRSPLLLETPVLLTSNPPPYNGKAKCVLCWYAMDEHAPGFSAKAQYKCSTCPDCFICEVCQEDMTKNWIPEVDGEYEHMLPHTPTHHVYRTEVPDPTTPPVSHTAHPPNETEVVEVMPPPEQSSTPVLHAVIDSAVTPP